MSNLIRLAAGQVTAFDLLNTDSYLVSNFPRQSDMTASHYWSASQPNKMLMREQRPSLGIGGSRYVGGYFGELSFFHLTEDMRQYLDTGIFGGNPSARVTVYMATTLNSFQVLTGELTNPFSLNAESDFETSGYENTHTNVCLFSRGTILDISNLLLMTGDNLLLMSGEKLALMNQ